jgi:N6-L-threonylcarbamoyladenine synthase
VLLVSGGHCLLAVAKNVDEFLLLGESVDSAPGEVLDKVWFNIHTALIYKN